MAETDVFRNSTELEKQNYIELKKGSNKTALDLFLGELAKKQQEYSKEFKPFCTRCARVDFEKFVVDNAMEMELSDSTKNEISKFKSLDEYGKDNRFAFIESREIREDKLLDGIRTPVVTGKVYVFRCIVRGCGHKIFVGTEDVEAFEKNVLSKYITRKVITPEKEDESTETKVKKAKK